VVGGEFDLFFTHHEGYLHFGQKDELVVEFWETRDKKSVVLPGMAAQHGARSISSYPIGFKPFPVDGFFRRATNGSVKRNGHLFFFLSKRKKYRGPAENKMIILN
jgi:hypothetical protein